MRSRTFLLVPALLSAGSGSMPAMAQVTLQPAPVTAHPHAAFIAEASQRFGIPEHWIRAVLRVESAGDVRAISSAGAMGLMQVMPDTWAGLRRRHGLGRDPYDPRDNIFAGTAYLREMWDRYGNVAAMLAAAEHADVPVVPPAVEVHLLDDAAIGAANRRCMGCQGPTNVLSFPGGCDSPGTLLFSLDTLRRECLLYGQDADEHALRLLAHGMAHLCGLDHGVQMDMVSQYFMDAAAEAAARGTQ